MAGRGRGRGKTVSFDVQALGFGRGEALPTSCVQPPPLFPIQAFKPVPLIKNEDADYLLALKQEFMATLKKSVYHLKADEKKRDIERYSDKYQLNQADSNDKFDPDWRRLPDELKIKPKRLKVRSKVKPNLSAAKMKVIVKDTEEIVKTLENLEKKEITEGGEEEEEKEEGEKEDDEEDEEALEEGEFDDEELEEETDYGMNYFDNGEGYGDDDGDDDEGPTY